jgi:hypothetical protein
MMTTRHHGSVRPLRYRFDEPKAIAAVHHLLNKTQAKRHNYTALIKILYLSEREHLNRYATTICGDAFASLPYGPILSNVTSLIREDARRDSTRWYDHFRKDGYELEIIAAADEDVLSEAELEILDEVWAANSSKTWQALITETHQLPEWENPLGSSIPISPEEILRVQGYSEDDIDRVAQEHHEQERFSAILRSPGA